jgi:hypothetical protein
LTAVFGNTRRRETTVPSGILVVQSRPSSPEEATDYHRWYVDVHVPEMLKIEGVVSARRLEALDGGSFLAVYEVDGEVVDVKEALANAQRSGSMSRPVGLQLDPPPTMQWFRDMGKS